MDLYFEVAAEQKADLEDEQQGAFASAWLDDGSAGEKSTLLLVMARGIGGHASAQEASELIVAAFQRGFVQSPGRTVSHELLRASAISANRALAESINRAPALEGVACTLIGATLRQGLLHWVSVGDSHLYLLRDGQLRKLNEDHRYGAYLARARAVGVEAEPEPGITPDMLMSAITGEPIGEIDCRDQGLALLGGDRLVLCSQVVETVGDARIVDILGRCAKAGQGATALLRATERFAGAGPDGVTAVVVDVHDRDAEAAAAMSAGLTTTESAQSRAPEPARRSRVLDVVMGLMTLAVFVAAASGTWFGLGWLDAFRRPTDATPGAPPVAVTAPGYVPADGKGAITGQGPGLTFGAPPVPGMPRSAPEGTAGRGGSSLTFGAPPVPGAPRSVSGGAAASGGGSLTFGAPAPAPRGAETPRVTEASVPVAGGFRDPLQSGGDAPLMVRIPAGRFEMGSRTQPVRVEERPVRRVSVAAFALGAFEVTVAQYERFARDTGRRIPTTDAIDPDATAVSKVSWDDAYDYARWLSRQTGQRYRLPSEAEWEYAAGGGVAGPYWWGQEVGENRAHCADCVTALDPSRPASVGRFAANPFGLHDTAGNVAEWVHDCWHATYAGAPDDGRVWEGGDCSVRVVRGGGFSSPSGSMRVQARARALSNQTLDDVGFRVARDL